MVLFFFDPLHFQQEFHELSLTSNMNGFFQFKSQVNSDKLGCVVRMVVDSILPHAEGGPNDHRKDAPLFRRKDDLEHISQS